MMTIRSIAVVGAALLTSSHAHAADNALYEAAKNEGTVVWYTSLIVNQAVRPLVEAFEKKYPGVTVKYARADSGPNAIKVIDEARAGKVVGDVFDGIATAPPLLKAGLVAPFTPSDAGKYPPEMRDPDGRWNALVVYFLTPGINTQLVGKDEIKTAQDLLNPKWKGKIAWPVLSSIGATLFVTNLRLAWGDAKALAYLQALSKQNIINFGAGNPRTLVDRVIAGEYPIALQVFAHHPLISAAKGAPVTSVLLPPVASAAATVVMPKEVRHPNAAMLLMDFLLSRDGQQILAKSEYLPVRTDVEPLPQLAPIVPSRAGVAENFISPEKLVAYTESSSKIVEQLFR
jgi:ABC-type Fe3+ transport system substrate-binding protein